MLLGTTLGCVGEHILRLGWHHQTSLLWAPFQKNLDGLMCPPHFSARFKGRAAAQRVGCERWQEVRCVPCLEARTTNSLAGLILQERGLPSSPRMPFFAIKDLPWSLLCDALLGVQAAALLWAVLCRSFWVLLQSKILHSAPFLC